jgi:hypothetical protein
MTNYSVPQYPQYGFPSSRIFELARRHGLLNGVLNIQSLPFANKTRKLALRRLRRAVQSHFRPIGVIDETHFLFLMKKLGITEGDLIDKIRQETQLPDQLYDNTRLKGLFSEAVEDNCQRSLPKQLHSRLMITMLNKKAIALAPVQRSETGFAVSSLPEKQETPPADESSDEEFVTRLPPKRAPPPGNRYLPGFYDHLNLPIQAEKKIDIHQ